MRWRLEGADGQGALFDHVERVPGRDAAAVPAHGERLRAASAVRIRRWKPVEQVAPAAPPPPDPAEQLSLGV